MRAKEYVYEHGVCMVGNIDFAMYLVSKEVPRCGNKMIDSQSYFCFELAEEKIVELYRGYKAESGSILSDTFEEEEKKYSDVVKMLEEIRSFVSERNERNRDTEISSCDDAYSRTIGFTCIIDGTIYEWSIPLMALKETVNNLSALEKILITSAEGRKRLARSFGRSIEEVLLEAKEVDFEICGFESGIGNFEVDGCRYIFDDETLSVYVDYDGSVSKMSLSEIWRDVQEDGYEEALSRALEEHRSGGFLKREAEVKDVAALEIARGSVESANKMLEMMGEMKERVERLENVIMSGKES